MAVWWVVSLAPFSLASGRCRIFPTRAQRTSAKWWWGARHRLPHTTPWVVWRWFSMLIFRGPSPAEHVYLFTPRRAPGRRAHRNNFAKTLDPSCDTDRPERMPSNLYARAHCPIRRGVTGSGPCVHVLLPEFHGICVTTAVACRDLCGVRCWVVSSVQAVFNVWLNHNKSRFLQSPFNSREFDFLVKGS